LRPNEVRDSSLPQTPAADRASAREFGLPDSAAKEALDSRPSRKIWVRYWHRCNGNIPLLSPAAAEHPNGRRGNLLFWIVIAISAGAIVASLAIR
jgi:hypothetical protein